MYIHQILYHRDTHSKRTLRQHKDYIWVVNYICRSFSVALSSHYQDGRVVKALDLSSNGRVVRVGSNPTPGN